ncbi:MAG: hypothetical protein VB115_15155 [Christensenellaceae bacterium]|nr:hypothetical protein [Christensenellaceae bacterium]
MAKDSAGERELVRYLTARGFESRRNNQGYAGDAGSPDVSLEGIHIKCKRADTLCIHEALRQAVNDAQGSALPVVMHPRKGGKWIAVMQLEDWLKLYELMESPKDRTPAHEA